jgi:hypothetical protein
MWMRVTRWAVAALIGSAMTSVSCGRARPQAQPELASRRPVVADDSLVHAFDMGIETRLLDRIELDNFLRDRDIHVHVVDGVVSITGEVWTPLERERVGELVRGVAGVVDVSNELVIHPPE